MTKEGKTVSLAILTVFTYAIISFFDHFVLLFPFPLNNAIFFVVALYFAFLNFKINPVLAILTSVIGVSSVFSSEFYWSIFLSSEKMSVLSESLLTDFIKITYYLGLICWIIETFRKKESVLIRVFGLFSIFLLCFGAVWNNLFLELGSIFIPFIYSIRFKTESEYLKLWILLFVLECTKVWSLVSFK